MSSNTNKKFLNIILIIVLVIGLCAGGVAIWVAEHYKVIVKDRLPGWVSKSTDSLYYISFEDISINIFTRRITVTDIKVWHDTAQRRRLHERGMAPHFYFHGNIPEMQLRKIAWEELIGEKNLGCGNLIIYNPKITVMHMPELADSLKDTTKKKSAIEKLFIDEIELVNGTVIYRAQKQDFNALVYAKGLNVIMRNWTYVPGQEQDTSTFLYAKSAHISLKQVLYKKDKFPYAIRTGNIAFEPDNDSLTITDFKLSSMLDKKSFYQQAGVQKDMFDLHFPVVAFNKFEWQNLMGNGVLAAHNVTIKNAVVSDYFSRLAPPNNKSKLGKYPHQLLKKVKLPLNIEKITLKNAKGSYTEVSDVTKNPGTLLFTSVNGVIKNVTNMPEAIAKNRNCVLQLYGKFMRQSDIAATFNFVLDREDGAFSVNSYLKNLQAAQINNLAQALALAEIKSASVSRMDITITGNENQARGEFVMRYQDLKLTLQKMNDDSTGFKRRGLLSFLANNILLYPDNPMPGEELRRASTVIVRDPYKSFFNLIWKNIFEGAIKTVARNEDLINIFRKDGNQQAEPQKDEKRGLFDSIFERKNKKKKKEKQRE